MHRPIFISTERQHSTLNKYIIYSIYSIHPIHLSINYHQLSTIYKEKIYSFHFHNSPLHFALSLYTIKIMTKLKSVTTIKAAQYSCSPYAAKLLNCRVCLGFPTSSADKCVQDTGRHPKVYPKCRRKQLITMPHTIFIWVSILSLHLLGTLASLSDGKRPPDHDDQSL